MKILIIHNRYRFTGGEDVVVRLEADLLRRKGHEVYLLERSNAEFDQWPLWRKIRYLIAGIFFSMDTLRRMKLVLGLFNPDVVHVHNIFFIWSPSIYWVCFKKKIPIVQTLHNYRFFCANGVFYRAGKLCQACIPTVGLSALWHRCIRKSFMLTFAYWIIQKIMRFKVMPRIAAYIAPGNFVRKTFKELLPSLDGRMHVKGNFLEVDRRDAQRKLGRYVLFVGALMDYKGIDILLKAFEGLDDIPLVIVGDGLIGEKLRAMYPRHDFRGELAWNETLRVIEECAFVVVPSQCFETFSRIVIECYACSVPVIASNIGAVGERIVDKQTGLLFEPQDIAQLRAKIRWLYDNPKENNRMGIAAREEYELRYKEEANYAQLINVYESVVASR